MDELEKIDEVMASLRRSAIARAGKLDPSLLEQVAEDQRAILSHEARLEAASQRRQVPPPRPKTTEEQAAEKEENEIQARVAKAVQELEAERASQPEE